MQERRVLEALLGAYVATLLIPGAALFTGTVDADGALVLVVAGLIVAVLVARMARTVEDLADTVASAPVVAASVLPPLAYLPYMILAAEPESPAALVSLVGLVAFLPGIGVPIGGAVIRNRRLREAATEVAVVTVGGGEDDDGTNWAVVAGVSVVSLSIVVAGVIVLVGGDVSMSAVTPALGGISTLFLLFADDDATEIAVTDRGLRIDRSFTTWDDFEGYRLTDDEIELVRSQWYLPAGSFEREEVDDENSLIEGLERHLPRLDERGRVELSPRGG
ncbi:MAG: hypothetical protein ABEH88_05225 [Halobacteriales archaeon]